VDPLDLNLCIHWATVTTRGIPDRNLYAIGFPALHNRDSRFALHVFYSIPTQLTGQAAHYQVEICHTMFALRTFNVFERQDRQGGLQMPTRHTIAKMRSQDVLETHCVDGGCLERLVPVAAEQVILFSIFGSDSVCAVTPHWTHPSPAMKRAYRSIAASDCAP
jgi:hypothetical protein